jgi:phospholipid/cholesterol/gamma-HCH transport system permease protein
MKLQDPGEAPLRVEDGEGGELRLKLRGSLTVAVLREVVHGASGGMAGSAATTVAVDLGGVGYLDSAGALAVLKIEAEARARGMEVTFLGVSSEASRIIALVQSGLPARVPPPRPSPGFLVKIGETSRALVLDAAGVLVFLGELLRSLFRLFLRPRSVRWEDWLFFMRRAGLDGLPIVGLLSFLLGMVIAFMTSLQLRQFGANAFIPTLVGVAMVKELGPIMTAVLVAGRSGSAFAAEIGTMKVNDEVDALTVMGFDPVEFLAVPRVLAALVVVPLLTLYADFFGMAGGMLVGVAGLDLTAHTWIQQTAKGLKVFDFASSYVKSVAFAFLIAGIGCQRGFEARGGAEAVGERTTSAVVTGLFLIIVADAFFAIVLHYLR